MSKHVDVVLSEPIYGGQESDESFTEIPDYPVRVYDWNHNLVYAADSTVGYRLSTFNNHSDLMEISSGGIAIGTEISFTTQEIYFGGLALNTSMTGGRAVQEVFSGGVASGTAVSGAATQIVHSGGLVRDAVFFDAQQYVDEGGMAFYTVIGSGGLQKVYGEAVDNVVSSGGSQTVYSGGAVGGVRVKAGGRINVASGAVVRGADLASGAMIGYDFDVDCEATSAGSTLALVNSMSCDFEIGSGVCQVVSANYISLRADICSGGGMLVLSGGVASGARVESQGVMTVSGGRVYDTIVEYAGTLRLCSGAVAYNTVLEGFSDGILYVDHGAVIYDNSSYGTVSLSGASYRATVYAREFTVNAGGEAHGTIIVGGCVLNSGFAFGTRVEFSFMRSTGKDYGTVIVQGSHYLEQGAFSYNTEIQDGIQYVYGAAYDAKVMRGDQQVTLTGRSTRTQIESGRQLVCSGGVAEGTVVWGDGEQLVRDNGSAYGASIHGGIQNVYSGGAAFDTEISIGIQLVRSGGLAESSYVYYQGFQVVGSGGTAVGTVVEFGGGQVVSGGVIKDTRIGSQGIVTVYSGELAGTVSVRGSLVLSGSCTAASGGVLLLALDDPHFTETPMVSGADFLSGAEWRADAIDSGAYYLASDAANLWSGVDGGLVVAMDGETVGTLWKEHSAITVDGISYMLRNDVGNDLVIFVYRNVKAATGGIFGDDAELSLYGSNVSQLVNGVSRDVAGDATSRIDLLLENTCNIYGGGGNVSVGGTINLAIGLDGNSFGANRYTGTIYGGSRAYSDDVSTGDINITVSNIIHVDNVRMLKYGQTAWLVGGGYASDGALAAGDVTISVIGGILTNVVGGAQAQGVGGVAAVASTSITISNAVINGDVYGGGYAYDSAVSVVTGNVSVVLDSVIYTAAGRSIYAGGANPSHLSRGGSSIVNGDASITFRGVLDAALAIISGDGKVAGTVLGTKTLHFDDCFGEFSATIQSFDEIAFAGNTEVSHSGLAVAQTFMFDVSTRDGELSRKLFAEGFSFGDGDKLLKIEIGNTESNFQLMAGVEADELAGMEVELYRGGALYAAFEFGQEYKGYSVRVGDTNNLVLTWHPDPW